MLRLSGGVDQSRWLLYGIQGRRTWEKEREERWSDGETRVCDDDDGQEC